MDEKWKDLRNWKVDGCLQSVYGVCFMEVDIDNLVIRCSPEDVKTLEETCFYNDWESMREFAKSAGCLRESNIPWIRVDTQP
jgi:hypothetical protein